MFKRQIIGLALSLLLFSANNVFAACAANASVNGTNSSGTNATYLAAASGCAVTPTSYQVKFYKIEFQNSTGSWITFLENTSGVTIDIASANPGATAGAVGSGVSLAAGTYTNMRITIDRSFGIIAAAADSGTGGMPCATSSAISSTSVLATAPDAGLNGFPLAAKSTYNPGTAAQTVPVPNITAVNNAITAIANLSATTYNSQSALVLSTAVSFTVPANAQTLPSMQMSFDAKDTIEFAYDGTSCAVLVTPPSVSFSL